MVIEQNRPIGRRRVLKRLDKAKNYDKIIALKALTELNLFRCHEREGTVGALGRADRCATPEQTPRRGTVDSRYRIS